MEKNGKKAKDGKKGDKRKREGWRRGRRGEGGWRGKGVVKVLAITIQKSNTHWVYVCTCSK